MAKINAPPPRGPSFPWGEPKSVRERLVDPSQVVSAGKRRRKGDPKDPPLASVALMDFIGPSHSGEDLRLPPPPALRSGAELAAASDRPHLRSMVNRANSEQATALEDALGLLRTSTE